MGAIAMLEPATSGMLAHDVLCSPTLATCIAEPELLLVRSRPARDLLAELLLTGAYSDGLSAWPDPPGVPAVIALVDAVLTGARSGDPKALAMVRRMLSPSRPARR